MAGTPVFPDDPKAAVALQRRLAQQVRLEPLPSMPERIAGLDCALSKASGEIVGVAVLMDFPSLSVIEQVVRRRALTFPYIPGLLSFREGPVLFDALSALKGHPDLLIFDGQGIAHPRRLGIAAHLGVLTDLASIGIAKSRLTGEERPVGPSRGDWAPLEDKGELLGVILRSRDGVKPIYVSPGHRCDVEGARRMALACGKGYRLPEPTRLADRLSKQAAATSGWSLSRRGNEPGSMKDLGDRGEPAPKPRRR